MLVSSRTGISAVCEMPCRSWHSDEQASISVTSVESGDIVYAYSTNKKNSARGKRTSAESCAKHLKEAVEKPK